MNIEHVVSKWYGDSEKRLAEIWNACENMGGAVIFLDEVDALGNSRDKVYIYMYIYIYMCTVASYAYTYASSVCEQPPRNQQLLYMTAKTCALLFLSPSNPTKLQEGFFQCFCKKSMVLRGLRSLHSFVQQTACRIWMLLFYHDMISQYTIIFQVSCCLPC